MEGEWLKMALVEEIEKIADNRVDQRMDQITEEIPYLRPWLIMETVEKILEKEARWIRENFCTDEMVEKKLVKKVGGKWHFMNPEFMNYVHDVWWNEV